MEENEIIFEKLKQNNLTITLSNNHAQLSIEETLTKYAKAELKANINLVQDAEPNRFRPAPNLSITFIPNFNTSGGFSPSYQFLGFLPTEIYKQSPSLRHVIYIFEYFSSNQLATQQLLASQLVRATDSIVYDNTTIELKPSLRIDDYFKDEFNTISINKIHNVKKVYLRISFFNSKTNKIGTLQNSPNSVDATTYFQEIQLTDNTYYFTNLYNGFNQLYESTSPMIVMPETSTLVTKVITPVYSVNRQVFQPFLPDSTITP